MAAALLLFLLLFPGAVFSVEDESPLAPADTSSPRATMESFINNFHKGYALFIRAREKDNKEPGFFISSEVRRLLEKSKTCLSKQVQCFNLSEVAPRLRIDEGIESAMLLSEIFARIPLPPYDEIPGPNAVKGKDGIKSWKVPKTEIEIELVLKGPDKNEFLFTSETVEHIKGFYEKVKSMPYKPGAVEGVYEIYMGSAGWLIPPKWVAFLPKWTKWVYWDQTLWQWMALGFSLIIIFLINYPVFRFLRQKHKPRSALRKRWLNLLLPATFTLSIFLLMWFMDLINITGVVFIRILVGLEMLLWLILAWSAVLLSDVVAETIIISPKINPKGIDASLVRTIGKLLGIFAGIYILVVGLSELGFSLVPILTSLGVAGLAISLAARPTIENIIGGIMLYADRPVRVGDFCKFGKISGTVVHIGLRSTRIRGMDRTLISVPNADFSQLELINLTRRDRIRLKTVLGLRYETTPDQLRHILTNLREMLIAHPKIYEDGVRVRFIGFGDFSLDLEVQAFARTREWDTFLGIQEDIFLRIMRIVEGSGTGFAFPSQTVYVGKDTALPADLQQAAELEVQSWRSQGKLPFPDIPEERRKELLDTLDFPPEGSSQLQPVDKGGSCKSRGDG
ncbi:MAG: mechanosensitive ion channel family protein [Candidatus Desulfacyla sp.]